MKNYVRHFRFVFIALGVLLVVYIAVFIGTGRFRDQEEGSGVYVRTNTECLEQERVFDYADKLTDEEEEALRKLIADTEDEIGCDIILMTISDETIDSDSAMMNYADDFYDNNKYGYNEPWGDGALYLDNWANGYVWLSTCGRVEMTYSSADIDLLIGKVCDRVNDDPYGAYVSYVHSLAATMTGESRGEADRLEALMAVGVVSFIATLIYVIVNLIYNKGKRTTTASTYVPGGRPFFKDRKDVFVSKHTTSRRIESSGGGGGGGGGHHISSGGHSHGGGGGRH